MISQHERTGAPEGVVPDDQATPATGTRLRLLVVSMTAAGSVAVGASLMAGDAGLGPVAYVAVFTVLLVLASSLPFTVIRKGEGKEFTADEAVLVAMLVVLPVGGVLAAALIADAVAHLVRRRGVWKAVFNQGAGALAVSAAILVRAALGDPPVGSHEAGALAAAAAGVLVYSVVSYASTWFAIASATGTSIRAMVAEEAPTDVVATVVAVGWGVLAVSATTNGTAAVAVLTVPIVGSWLVRHNEQQRRSMRALLDAAVATGQAVRSGSAARELTKAADEVLRTQGSRLSRTPPGPGESASVLNPPGGERWLIAGERHRWVRRQSEDETLLDALAAIGDIALRNEALLDAAGRDPDTGLITGAVLQERIDLLLESHRSEGLSVLVIRVPRLDVVNQTLGPSAARRERAEVASRLRLVVDEPASAEAAPKLVGYLHDGDYVVVLPTVSSGPVALGTARMLQRQLHQPLTVDGVELSIDVTIGVCVCTPERQPDATAGQMLHDAVVTAARIARVGGERIQLTEDSQTSPQEAPFALEAELRLALQRRELVVAYQPIVSTADAHVVGAEALVRWKHPQRGWLQPGAFIPIAEQTALIVGIDRYVLREVAHQLRSWSDDGLEPSFAVAVNLSARHLTEPDTVGFIRSLLDDTGIRAHRIKLEVTESSVTLDAVAAAHTLDELHRLGLGIAIDDFGTGYSSLLYLRDFPADTLKIDRSFIARMLTSSGDAAIVAAIIRLGHTLGLSTVAEGVETDEQLVALRSLGCDTAQGFLWSKAVRPERFRQRWWPQPDREVRLHDERSEGTALDDTIRDDALPYVIHELRSPLFAIDAYARLATKAPPGPAGAAESAAHLERIIHAAATMSAILDDLRDVGTLELNRMDLAVETVDLNVVVSSIVELLRPALGDRSIELAMEDDMDVDADVHRIGQVLRNLLTNADKFSPPDEPITVRAQVVPGGCRVEVRDRGSGVPPEQVRQLFRRFTRMDPTTPGMGIGLHLARKIARAHGGDVTYQASADGIGSTFTLHLPMADRRHHDAPPNAELDTTRAGHTSI